MSGANPAPAQTADDKLKNIVLAVNLLYAASFFVGITSIVGLVLAYMKRADAAGTIWESHLTYAIRTFWIGLAIGFLGLLLLIVGIGLLILGLCLVWFIVRLVRSFIAWDDGKPIADPKRFF